MEPYVFHSDKDHSSKVRVTVVGEFIDGKLKLSASRCSDKDAFVKKIGRENAIKRLMNGELIAEIETKTVSKNMFIKASEAVAHAVITFGVHKKIDLISSDKVYTLGFFDFENGKKDDFSYIVR